ncbi:lytic transglycosylase domain-containing protein [Methylibium rhizosphaerae]|uniref:lytic transglycosylase domain-containing protein n=1 Tax=Methylibium rhizosphaerae TaxID=2570323 RepID=UPI001FEC7E92|nr:lytic transglycosylase domain-containing protein [Methylibium rhizosphaerae]
MDRRRRRTLWHAACLTALSIGTGSEAAVRWRCDMLDGTQRVAMQDLSVRFSAAVRSCSAFETQEPAASEPVLRADGRLPGLPDVQQPFIASFPLRAPALELGAPHLQHMVTMASRRHGLDPRLVGALVHVESAYQTRARSPKGALGLMQIMPATGARYGVGAARDLLDPATNIDVGTRYLRDLHEMFDGRVELVLAAYNAGEGAVKRYGNRIPPYRETQDYVQKILRLYNGR